MGNVLFSNLEHFLTILVRLGRNRYAYNFSGSSFVLDQVLAQQNGHTHTHLCMTKLKTSDYTNIVKCPSSMEEHTHDPELV